MDDTKSKKTLRDGDIATYQRRTGPTTGAPNTDTDTDTHAQTDEDAAPKAETDADAAPAKDRDA